MLMIEQRDSKLLVNKLREKNYTTIPVNYLEATLSGISGRGEYSINSGWTIPGYQPFHSIIRDRSLNLFSQDCGLRPGQDWLSLNKSCNYLKSGATGFVQCQLPQCQAPVVPDPTLQVNNDSLFAYQQRWEKEITSRFRESKKRFPEFFPCFELWECPQQGLQYSIHFEPLTGHAKALTQKNPIFPHQKNFKPIEKLWQADGASELDVLFNRFPTQLALLPPKQSWGARMWKLLLGLVHQGLELRHVGSLLTRKA